VPGVGNSLPRVIFNNGSFYFYRDGTIRESSDGITWTVVKELTADGLSIISSFTASPDIIVGVGYTSAVGDTSRILVRS
jgi:hypothetical protein